MTLMAHSQVEQRILKGKEKRVMERALYLQPGVVPSATIRHEVANLAVTVRRFLELTQDTYQRYFVRRGLFHPVDELAFEQDWNTFFQAAVQLQKKFETGLDHVEGLEPVPEQLASLQAQVRAYQTWLKKVRFTRGFTTLGKLLESMVLRDHAGVRPRAALCHAEQVLTAMLTAMNQPAQ
jgi:hypothetical protein